MSTESRTEQLLNAYINGDDISNFVPLSRNEQILKDMILGNEQTSSPQSRIESLYKKLDEKIKNSSGSDINTLQYVIDNKNGDGKPSCASLFRDYKGTNLDIISQCDFSKVTDMTNMFNCCSNLTTIPLLDTSNVTDMQYMFYSCSKLTTIPQLDTSSCTRICYMFNYCSNLTTIPLLDTSNVTDMQYMFSGCSSLTTIPQLNTRKNKLMYYMFNGCSKLTTIPQLDTSSCTNMSYMFNGCSNLITIPQLDTSSCTSMSYMFNGCSNLTTIPQLDTSSCTNMSYMFYNCKKLKTIDITHMKITNTSYSTSFAYNCYSLAKLIIRNMDTIPILNLSAFESCYHFYGTTNATYNPEGLKDGRIYVPDDKVDELKAAEKWNAFADIIRPLSEYVEEVDLKSISGYEDEQGNITTNELTYEVIN